MDVAFDAAGNLYILDNRRVRKVSRDGIITTVAGNGTNGFSGDGGPATAAAMAFATGLDVDSAGNIYIADGTTIASARCRRRDHHYCRREWEVGCHSGRRRARYQRYPPQSAGCGRGRRWNSFRDQPDDRHRRR